jgi:putative colanic acid biosynthesis UDP-glucose lipid carrier transferase
MSDRYQGRGVENVVFVASRWLLPPVVTTANLLILMWAFGVPLTDEYLPLLVTQFMLVFFIFKEAYSVSLGHETILKILFARSILPWLIVIGLLIFVGFISKVSAEYSRAVLLTWFIQAPLLVAMSQDLLNRLTISQMVKRGGGRSAAIVGVNALSERLAKTLEKHTEYGINLVGYFDDRSDERIDEFCGQKVLGCLADVADFAKQQQIDIIYLTLPVQQEGRVAELLDTFRDTTASIYLVPDLFIVDLIQARADSLGDIPIVALCETPFHGVNALVKRSSDIVLGTLGLIVASPIMLLVAIGIKLTSRGPVVFKQLRYGLDGQEILIYKFRSMRVMENTGHIKQATQNDARVTPFGNFLRRSSLDELPQLVNVLQGRMSLVGPRPHAVAHNEMYRQLIKGYMVRHKVTPGITGLAQVKGWRGETEDLEAMKRRIDYDLEYLRNWSLALDIEILFKTVFTVWGQRAAY